jgi:uncharacterized membrane protein YdjX (TVP38/TMEM64 family)
MAALPQLMAQVELQQTLQNVLTWVDSLGAAGAIAFILLYTVATVLLIPASLITLGGGALFGVALGFLYVFVGAAIGATLAFLLGRYALRNWVTRRISANPKFKAIDQAIAREGFKIVLLTRLSPLIPFNLLNYGLGVTQVSLKDYLLGFVGVIPATLMYVYFGSLAGSLARLGSDRPSTPETERLQWIVRIIGFIATVAVTVYITRIAKQALDQSVASSEVSHVSHSDR